MSSSLLFLYVCLYACIHGNAYGWLDCRVTGSVANCVYKKRKACRTTKNGGYCNCKKQ